MQPTAHPSPTPSGPRRVLFVAGELVTGLALITLIAWMTFSPFNHRFASKENKVSYTRDWRMFRGPGKNICKVKMELRERKKVKKGKRGKKKKGKIVKKPLDRFELLGYDSYLDAPKSFRWAHDKRPYKTWYRGSSQVDKMILKVCDALGEDEQKLAVRAECANWHGWYVKYKGRNAGICKSIRKKTKSSKRKRSQGRKARRTSSKKKGANKGLNKAKRSSKTRAVTGSKSKKTGRKLSPSPSLPRSVTRKTSKSPRPASASKAEKVQKGIIPQ